MGDVGRFRFLGWVITRDSFRGKWEVIQPAKEGKLEVSYRWFRTSKDSEDSGGWLIQMQGLEEACTHTVQYMGLQQAKGVERSNEAIE